MMLFTGVAGQLVITTSGANPVVWFHLWLPIKVEHFVPSAIAAFP